MIMNKYISTIMILVTLIAVVNRREISAYVAWLRFKIYITLKQRKNDRVNSSNRRSQRI